MPPGTRRRGVGPPRRSARTAVLNANGKRASADTNRVEWRGERRSSRLGGTVDTESDAAPHPKRARTEESTTSGGSARAISVGVSGVIQKEGSGLKIKIQGATAIRPSEVAIEQIAGKKKSKYWFYAVEPAPGLPPRSAEMGTDAVPRAGMNGLAYEASSGTNRSVSSGTGVENYGGHSVSPGPTSDG